MNFRNFVNTRYCVVHVDNITLFSHLYIHKHTQTHAHTHTHTHAHAKFKFFHENIRSTKGSEQNERNKLKYFHYLNKMIKNAR